MSWQFTIIDYTSNTNGVSTPIVEPVGWDGINLHLKRDEHWHGFFSYVDDSFGGLQFDGAGATILRNAYYNYGVDADVRLSISYSCGQDDENNLALYIGSFYFSSFKDYLADRCYVECSLEANKDFMNFKNRVDQEVDLDSLASFDQKPVPQTVVTSCLFQSGTNVIEVNQLMNGILPGSQIVISGSSFNNGNGIVNNDGTYTVASAKPDYSTVQVNVVNNSATTQTVSAQSVTFNPDNSTISVNQVLMLAPGPQTITLDTGNSGDLNSRVYTVINAVAYFNYTLFTVSPAPASLETADNCSVSGTFVASNQPTRTIITVGEAIQDAGPVTASVAASWLINNLTPYSGLGQIITIPSKEIRETSYWKSSSDTVYDTDISTSYNAGRATHTGYTSLTPDWSDILSEVNQTGVGTGSPNVYTNSNPPDTLIYLQQMAIPCSGAANLQISVSGVLQPTSNGGNYGIDQFAIVGIVDTGYNQGGYTLGDGHEFLNYQVPGAYPGNGVDTLPFNYSNNFTFPDFEPGNYLWIMFFVAISQDLSGHNHHNRPELRFDSSSFFKFYIDSKCEDTPCAVYFVNEAMSRCVESYTNGDMYVYSDYFGRSNSQPYPTTSGINGCGSMEAITNGLRIRGCLVPDRSDVPKFTTSMKAMFEALDAIHNIGMCLENDSNGKPRIRVEPFDWFFPNTVIQQANNTPMLFSNVMKYSREVQPSMLYGGLKCGYQQFETWNNNGIYDIFSSRNYRTQLTELTNTVDKTTKWMASDYAIEFTRRDYGNSSADSRYDASTFILCLKSQWQSEISFTIQNCIIFYDPANQINYNDNIIVSNTAHNNSQNTSSGLWIAGAQPVDGIPGLKICAVSYASGSGMSGFLTNEVAASAGFKWTNGHSITYSVNNQNFSFDDVPVVFIGQNGALVLNTLPLYDAAVGDVLTINCSAGTWMANNNPTTSTINYIVSPQTDASPIGTVNQVNFPMVIMPASFISWMNGYSQSAVVAIDHAATIGDSSNQFYTVEQGVPISANILNPDTVMNYRISPAHNAMRHYQNMVSYRGYQSDQLIFTTGTGNFYALGSIGDSCSPEGNNLVSEGGNLAPAIFGTPADAAPLYYPEIVKFEYPLTWAQFVAIQANPYGLVEFFHTDEGTQQGWLAELQYKPYTGMAEFGVYPKIPS